MQKGNHPKKEWKTSLVKNNPKKYTERGGLFQNHSFYI